MGGVAGSHAHELKAREQDEDFVEVVLKCGWGDGLEGRSLVIAGSLFETVVCALEQTIL